MTTTELPGWLAEMAQDPTVDSRYLPPAWVLAALAGTATREERKAADIWVTHQIHRQSRAAHLLDILDEHWPVTEEGLSTGNLPGWLAYPWSETLHLEWSCDLATAIDEAETWIQSHGVDVNW